MAWRCSVGLAGLSTRKDITTPRVRFQFRSKPELEEMSRSDRTAYFEDILAALYYQRDDLEEQARDHLARVITDCVQFGQAWKRSPGSATARIPLSAPPKAESVDEPAGKT